MIITTGVLSFIAFVFVRYRERLITGAASRWIRARDHAKSIAERVLIIGAGDNGEMALWMLNRPHLARAFVVVGILDDDPRKQGTRVNGVEVIGTSEMLRDLVQHYDIGLIVYTIHNINPARKRNLIAAAHRTGIRTVVLPDLISQLAEPDLPTLLDDHPLDRPLNHAETAAALHHLSVLAQQGDLTAVQTLTDRLVNLLPQDDDSSS